MLSFRKLEYYRKCKISEPLLFLAGVCDQAGTFWLYKSLPPFPPPPEPVLGACMMASFCYPFLAGRQPLPNPNPIRN